MLKNFSSLKPRAKNHQTSTAVFALKTMTKLYKIVQNDTKLNKILPKVTLGQTVRLVAIEKRVFLEKKGFFPVR